MKFQRAELHNHTTESDGNLNVEELLQWGEMQGYEVLAITDHNTCSGHRKAEHCIQKKQLSLNLIKGIEITTFYGHILALRTDRMPYSAWLDPNSTELFFKKIRSAGASAIGLAHPCCIGRPVMAGCRFDMKLRDWNVIDYIEVFNTSTGIDEYGEQFIGNGQALTLWEDKVLAGYSLAAVSGKDIHQKPSDENCMITYAVFDDEEEIENLSDAVVGAILTRKTMVTKGPLMWASLKGGILTVTLDNSSDYFSWCEKYRKTDPMLVIRDDCNNRKEIKFLPEDTEIRVELSGNAKRAVVRLYDGDVDIMSLNAAGICAQDKGRTCS